MAFGRNPHVAKAEAAELKARSAKDTLAAEQAFREAARLWERAAERETDDKRKQQYMHRAESARAQADAAPAAQVEAPNPVEHRPPPPRSLLN